MATVTKKRKAKSAKSRYIGKPGGLIQQRVQLAGPQHFGVISVDCAKRRSKWMLSDFYGKVIIEPTIVEHTAGAFKAMIVLIKDSLQTNKLIDSIASVEMTGVYHRPIQAALRKAGFDTRTVHPFASEHYRQTLHADLKTDDHDLEAIFHAAINGYGLAILPVDSTYQTLQALVRHRRNLIKQRARLQVQIRVLMHQAMPGFADLFEEDKLFRKSIALPIAKHYGSSAAIKRAGTKGLADYLMKQKIRFHIRTLERIVAWSATAVEPADLAVLLTQQWKQLAQCWDLITQQIDETEREMAKYLAKTPYVLLLSVTGINVVSAAALAGEAGPIEHYASARAITGRAGLFPSRYQSDEVDRNGKVARSCNRRLRAAAMMVAENLIKCHSYYRGLSALWQRQKVDPRDRRVRIANRAMRMVYQLVAGRQVWRGKGVDREYLLMKLREFHRTHQTPIDQTVEDMNEAFKWLPKSAYASEAKSLQELTQKKRRGAKSIGDLLLPLLIRLGVSGTEPLESTSSEAQGPA
jgi:transposase